MREYEEKANEKKSSIYFLFFDFFTLTFGFFPAFSEEVFALILTITGLASESRKQKAEKDLILQVLKVTYTLFHDRSLSSLYTFIPLIQNMGDLGVYLILYLMSVKMLDTPLLPETG